MNTMDISGHPAIILLAEDNPADQRLVQRALRKAKMHTKLYIAKDGEEAIHFLQRSGEFADPKKSPRPDLILLDINMPRMDGKEVLQSIRANASTKAIPVVMLTTSSYNVDINQSYNLGANAYLTKPAEMSTFIQAIQRLEEFWFELVVLPSRNVAA